MSELIEAWLKTEAIFHETVHLAEPARTLALESLCGDDADLMSELRALIAACEAEETHRSSTEARSNSVPQERIGPYALDRLLGRGGMGAVYLAHRADGHFTQQVAIKLIDLPLATDLFRERFRAERQILAGLVHPNIARLLDGGVSDRGELYLALEYIDGVTITDFCESRHLPVTARLELFLKVCDAVQFAHQNLVVHRDLKPDNILVDASGAPHLLDFGTAKILSPATAGMAVDLTGIGFQTFTPRFASPEQVLGRPITTASDIYSMGVLLHVLLTGAYPYKLADFTTEEMLRVICEQVPPGPASFLPSIDPDLHCIVLKALRKDPQERYTTAAQLSADLQAYLEHRPVQARRGNKRYIASKFILRNKVPLTGASLFLLTLLAAMGGIVWQARVANMERNKADARAADLRELSSSLLSELDEALKEIPGSTGAQQLLVSRVLQHLDRMARDSNGDTQSQLDVINAYTRLGDVQGNLYYQNVADTAGALASFDRALAISAPLAAAHPNDRAILRAEAAALEAKGETLSEAGNPQSSVASLQAAVDIYERAIKLPGTTAADIFEAAVAYETLGSELAEDSGMSDAAAGAAAYRQALAMDEQALRIDPAFLKVRRGIPLMHVHLGNVILETDPAAALKEFQLALHLQTALPEEQRTSLQQRRLRGIILRKTAEAYVELGQYAAAVPVFAQAEEIFRQLAAVDKKNTSALADMKRITDDEARMYDYAADARLAQDPAERRRNLSAAKDLLERNVSLTHQISALAPDNVSWQLDLASAELRLGVVRHALGLPPDDAASNAASLGRLRRAAEAPHAAASVMDLAVNGILNAQQLGSPDVSLAVPWAERGVLLTQGRSPAYYLLLARACRANRQQSSGVDAARKGIALLDKDANSSPGSRLRKLLIDESKISQ